MNKSVEILETFYQRMMPLFPPQAERLLDAINHATFGEVAFRYTFSVEAMAKVSHIIEEAALSSVRQADFHTSFQYLSRLVPQKEQYLRLANTGKRLWLYGAPDLADSTPLTPLLTSPQVVYVDTSGTPLINYWYVVAYGDDLSMTLLAQEIPALSGTDRYYEGFYTFDVNTAYQVIAILHRIYPELVPEPTAPEFRIR